MVMTRSQTFDAPHMAGAEGDDNAETFSDSNPTPEDAGNLQILFLKRNRIHDEISRFKLWFETNNLSTSASRLRVRLRDFVRIKAQFDKIHSQIEALDDATPDLEQATTRLYFENAYYDLCADVEDAIEQKRVNTSSPAPQGNAPTSTLSPSVQSLPNVIKPFSGIYTEWLPFYNTFKTQKSVNANGVIGSVDDNQEECAACTKGKCRSLNGLYTRPDLPAGYSLVAQIPQGACRILVQQLKHTRNHLALKNANGSFIVNGDWKISSPGVLEGAGTRFTYVKQDGTSYETISSPGPLANPVDIMIINFQTNLGVKYGYSLPMESNTPLIAPPLIKRPSDSGVPEPRRLETPLNALNQRDEARPVHRRTRLRRRFAWKISGVSACSKSCGGGLQATVVTCVREHTQTPVPDRRCSHLEKPMTQPIRCNVKDCPPYWEAQWTSCTVTCGEGIQHYVPQCHQELSTGRKIVTSDIACPRPKPASQAKPCIQEPCESIRDNELPQTPETSFRSSRQEWTVGPWSSCSVSCGTGHRTRSVSCASGRCHPEDRPKNAEYCENGPCSASLTGETSPWLLTEWSHCSESCGTGTQSRLAVCFHHHNCSENSKPETSRACSSDKQCGGQWFSGPWTPCSDSCSGHAKQKRDVFCVVKIRGQSHITNEMTCPAGLKPASEQLCNGKCAPKWFFGEWGVCEGACPNGVQRREVRCMDAQGKHSNNCADNEMPIAKRQCACHRAEEHRERYKPVQDEPADRSCIDRIRNCYLAVQARLCQYPYYTNHCCVSCKRAQQDLLE
ncbi:hypothetical protein Zmor_021431 [Zophobas morio]|uniref:PLAC domain-containing protein n=1 Tax=Zophobas morio TaxID=2755281 RepID=A0AA38I7V3_9CUCU|nr:hypothetical protein Zmor_021431 [Zophobas morio]